MTDEEIVNAWHRNQHLGPSSPPFARQASMTGIPRLTMMRAVLRAFYGLSEDQVELQVQTSGQVRAAA